MKQIKKIFVETKDKIFELKIPKYSRIIYINYLCGWPFEMSFEIIYENSLESEYDLIKYHIKFNGDKIPNNLLHEKTFFDKDNYDNYYHLYREI